MSLLNISRRGLIQALGGGLAVAFALPGIAEALEAPDPTIDLGTIPPAGDSAHLNAWLRIAPNGVVTIRMPAAEMGQGVYTALPMIVADALDCDWSMVRAESAPAHRDYALKMAPLPIYMQITGGSNSVRGYWPVLRDAGAAARMMLIEAAAERWGVKPEDCTTRAGVVTCNNQSATYGELAAAAALRKPPKKVVVKAGHTLIGTAPPRLDLPTKVTGAALFGVDVQVEGMVYGTVLPCPHYGGRLRGVDDSAARALPGVIDVLHFADEVVVVAEHFYQAKKAADLVKVDWDMGEGEGLDDAMIDAILRDALDGKVVKVQREGKPADGTVLEALYAAPYLDHAPMEPLSATARVTATQAEIWVGTQAQSIVEKTITDLTGLKDEQVQVHTTFLGGGFGRRAEVDVPRVAIQTAMKLDRPVKLIWTREASFTRGALRPAARCRFRAVLGEGTIQHWGVTVAAQNILARFVPGFLAKGKMGAMVAVEGLAEGPYHFPSIEVSYAQVELPITVGWWRSVHGSFNGFFRECFIDECAHALQKDPIALRRELLAHNPRYRAVLDLAVEKAGAVPDGQHRGVALFESFGSIVAEVADVSMVEGRPRVHRVVAAVDCGQVVHPEIVRAQIEGAATMGLSMLMGETLTLQNGATQQRNFHTYPILSPAEAPDVIVHIVPSTEPPGGIGEPGLPPLPGAVCNAIFAATGTRHRSMPIG